MPEPEVAPAAPAVVLVRPQEEGNVGAAARAMANMGLERLILVEPAVALGGHARALAVKAGPILDGAVRAASLAEALAPFARVVGTTAGRDRQPRARLVGARELGARLARDPGAPTALVFGPEASGLTGDELALCGLVVSIPCAPRQPTLNLAQAVLLVAYELFLARGAAPPPPAAAADDRPAAHRELEGLLAQAEALLARVGFARDDTFPGVLRDLRQLAARAGLTRREVAILRGICRRTGYALGRGGRPPGG